MLMRLHWGEVLQEELYSINFSLRKRLTGFQIIITGTLVFCLILVGILFFIRSQMPYNSEGSYFDTGNTIVYHEQSLDLLWSLLIILGLSVFASLVWCVRTPK